MKWRSFVAAIAVFIWAAGTWAFAATDNDSTLIRQTVMDYAEGVYSGDVARVERAVLPDLSRVSPRRLPRTGGFALAVTTYSQLVENARAKVGALPDTARHLDVSILAIDSTTATARVMSASFNEYVQLVKLNGQWRIINILWNGGPAAAGYYPGFAVDSERVAVSQAARDYLDGQFSADAAKLDQTLDPEFSKVNLAVIGQNGSAPTRQKYGLFRENALARVGKVDEVYRYITPTMLDAMNGLAVVKLETVISREYLQMYKKGDQWKVVASVLVPKTVSLQEAMTVTVGTPMPDFTLPVYGGGDFTLSKHRGKTVLLIFPRGWLGTAWCSYCQYQYLEFEDLDRREGIQKSLNLDVAFVMPYSSGRVREWMENFPDAVTGLEGIKNPTPAPAAGSIQEAYAAWVRANYPTKFTVAKDSPHQTIPVLVDEQRTLSRMLKIFTGFWDGATSEQNIATTLIIDKNGILQFKYVGQMTEDRPSVDFLLKLIRGMK